MSNNQIRYRSGYKYQLAENYYIHTNITPDERIAHPFITLDTDGSLFIRQDYAWDGPSGPTIDTKNFMRGSLVHDALYQLMRLGLLSSEQWRQEADSILQQICTEDGMHRNWTRIIYDVVRIFGERAADSDRAREIETAP